MEKITIKYRIIDGQLFVRLDGLLAAAKQRNNRTVAEFLTRIQSQIKSKISNDKKDS